LKACPGSIFIFFSSDIKGVMRTHKVLVCRESNDMAGKIKHGDEFTVYISDLRFGKYMRFDWETCRTIGSMLLPTCIRVCVACKAIHNVKHKCGACKVARYCSKTCQKENWKVHKMLCATI
jgi:hypothetical protein